MARSSRALVFSILGCALLLAPASQADPTRRGGRAGGARAGGFARPGAGAGIAGGGGPGAALGGRAGAAGGAFSGGPGQGGFQRDGMPGNNATAAPRDGAARSAGGESAATSSASRTTAASEDGVQGPRGGSVDVDQTTTGNSKTTTVNGESASGETATHTGTVTQENGYVTYDGSGSTSTGRNSETHAAGAMTDAGLVVGGTTTNNQGSAAGAALVNQNGVKAAGIATNGETVRAGAINTTGVPAAVVGSAYVYPYPVYGATVYHTTYGEPIYWWATTPVVAATVPIVVNGTTSSYVNASYSPVVSYATPNVNVYATTYAPHSLYAEHHGDRYFWVPGAAAGTSEVRAAIDNASRLTGPTAGGTVISYPVDGQMVYLTDARPMAGIYEERVGDLHGWVAGVSAPNGVQQQALETALTAHRQGGSEALAAAASQAGNRR